MARRPTPARSHRSAPSALTVLTDPTCCAPLGDAALSAQDAARLAPVFKALGDPVRLRLLSMIASVDEACVCDLTGSFTVGAPTISHHLKVLRDAGLVTGERRGTWVYYRARPEALAAVGELVRPPAATPAETASAGAG